MKVKLEDWGLAPARAQPPKPTTPCHYILGWPNPWFVMKPVLDFT